MDCLPAIDLRGGQCVRLMQGDFGRETTYGDPLEQARSFVAAGARWLHLVDLDAARGALPDNAELIAALLAESSVPVEVGGGIRDAERGEALLALGARRVIFGTAAVERPDVVTALAREHPGRVAVGLDFRHFRAPGADRRIVAVRGWEEAAGRELEEVLGGYEKVPLGAVIVTDIARDGTLGGPALEDYAELLDKSALPLVASGGIGGVADLVALRNLERRGRRLAGVIVGRALLSGALRVEEAVSACAP